MIDKQRIVYLFGRHKTATLSDKEKAEWTALLMDRQNDALVKEVLSADWDFVSDDSAQQIPAALRQRMLEEILMIPQSPQPTNVAAPGLERTARSMRKLAAISAAAVLVLAAGLMWWGLPFGNDRLAQTGEPVAELSEFPPAGNRANLLLPDGRSIPLDEQQGGIVVGEHIVYVDGSPITEQSAVHSGFGAAEQLTLSTPRGGTYHVTLPDGSQVWLNSGTTLTYPAQFDGSERIVSLDGEAFFKVTESGQRAFKVESGDQVVDVLGTEFNITAYAEDLSVKTTLVEGSVRISVPGPSRGALGSQLILVPGEQSRLQNGRLIKKTVNIEDAIAWRAGKFSFNHKPFEEIMNELSRWYDLEINYVGAVPEDELLGDAYRNQNLNFVFRLLDALDIDYKLDTAERKLSIYGKNN